MSTPEQTEILVCPLAVPVPAGATATSCDRCTAPVYLRQPVAYHRHRLCPGCAVEVVPEMATAPVIDSTEKPH